MKPVTIAGILLILLGVASLAYGGIDYTHQKTVLNIGSIHATKTEHDQIPLPPILGGVALAGGIALLAVGSRN